MGLRQREWLLLASNLMSLHLAICFTCLNPTWSLNTLATAPLPIPASRSSKCKEDRKTETEWTVRKEGKCYRCWMPWDPLGSLWSSWSPIGGTSLRLARDSLYFQTPLCSLWGQEWQQGRRETAPLPPARWTSDPLGWLPRKDAWWEHPFRPPPPRSLLAGGCYSVFHSGTCTRKTRNRAANMCQLPSDVQRGKSLERGMRTWGHQGVGAGIQPSPLTHQHQPVSPEHHVHLWRGA